MTQEEKNTEFWRQSAFLRMRTVASTHRHNRQQQQKFCSASQQVMKTFRRNFTEGGNVARGRTSQNSMVIPTRFRRRNRVHKSEYIRKIFLNRTSILVLFKNIFDELVCCIRQVAALFSTEAWDLWSFLVWSRISAAPYRALKSKRDEKLRFSDRQLKIFERRD